MDERRVDRFLEQAQARSIEDLIEAVDRINGTLQKLKLDPHFRLTNNTPEIKLPDIHRKDTVVINFPTGLIWLIMASPYVVIIGFALIFKFLPKLAILSQ